jgi:SagB-type dehydrogenase family enzyme
MTSDRLDELPSWTFFHENSKRGELDPHPTGAEVMWWMRNSVETLDLADRLRLALPAPRAIDTSLGECLNRRRSAYEGVKTVDLSDLSTILYAGYGAREMNRDSGRRRRTVASAGALYPLEVFAYVDNVVGVPAGILHFDPHEHCMRVLRDGVFRSELCEFFIQPEIPSRASVLLFLVGVFERSVAKYGDRGYRFTLIECGEVAQNVALACAALHIPSVSVGGYYDRDADDLLLLDGMDSSLLHVLAIGWTA